MAKNAKREYRLGDFWLSQRAGSSAWYRTWYDPAKKTNGKASLGTDDFEEAKRRLDAWYMAERMRAGRNLPPGDVKLADVFSEYEANHAAKLRSARTITILLRYWNEFWPDATVEDVRNIPKQEQFRDFLAAKGLRQNSINRTLEIGRAALNRAYRRGVVASVPYVQPLPTENVRPAGRPLSREECRRLYWDGSAEPHFRLYLLLALGTGARPEALFTLTWEQIDFANGLIHLNPEGRRQTAKRRPVVKLPEVLRQALDALPKDTPHVIMFRGRSLGRMVSIWAKARERAKLKGRVNAYSLRHTVASYLRAQGVPPWEVAAQLGHSLGGLSMTERYAHVDPTYLQNAATALNALLSFIISGSGHIRDSEVSKPQENAA